MIDAIFKNIEGCIWYLDDIFICSGNIEAEHQAILEKVLQQYVEYELALNLLKSYFYVHKTIYLAHIINS